MKKKGLVRIIFGYILIGFQILGMIGNVANSGALVPPHPTNGYTFAYLLGYFLIGIVGIVLLCFGYKARSNSNQ